MVSVVDDDGKVAFRYRSFVSVAGVVAMIVAGVVMVTGLAAMTFLLLETNELQGILAIVLSVIFTALIAFLVPSTNVTLLDNDAPLLQIKQKSRAPFPATAFTVSLEGHTIGLLQKSIFSRVVQNRWFIDNAGGELLAVASEESLSRALIRKIGGKFNRSLESDINVKAHGDVIARIIRRPDAQGQFDVLEVLSDVAVDRRLLIALATLVLGSEP